MTISLKKIAFYAPLAILTGLVVVGGSVLTAQRAQAGADDREIKDIVQTAFNTSVAFGKVDHIVGNTNTNPTEDLSVGLGKNDVAAAREHAHVTMQRLFASKCSVCSNLAAGVDEGLTAEENGVYRIVAGGIKDVEWRQVTINGDTAAVTLAATTWVKTISRNEFGKVEVQTPTEGKVQIFTLVRENGHWGITSIAQDQVATAALTVNQRPNNAAQPGDGIPGKPATTPQGGVKDTSAQ